MKLKSWLTYSYVLMAIIVVSVSLLSYLFIDKITQASDRILKDNYKSVEYIENMIFALDEINTQIGIEYFGNEEIKTAQKNNFSVYKKQFEMNLQLEEKNITEPGESELVSKLNSEYRNYLELFQRSPGGQQNAGYYHTVILPKYSLIKKTCYDILRINQEAILQKDKEAKTLSNDLGIYMMVASFCALAIAIIVIVKIPGIVINPVKELTEKVKAISQKKYSQQLDIHLNNELGTLVDEFNFMSGKLDEYEKTNIEKNIAEKKRAEAIVKSMRDGILVTDENDNVVLVNNVSEELFGVSESNMTGKNIFEISNYNNLMKSVSSDVSETGKNYLRIFYKDKEEFFLKEVIRVYDEERKSILGSIILLKNVTGFKELDEIKSGFVATVSHELRTPLSAISMSLRLLQDKRIGDMNEEQSKLIDAMKQEIKRLLKIVSELLNLSRIESGNEIMKYQTVSVDDILDAAITPLLMQFENKKIEFKMNVEKNIPKIETDVNKIAWVIINLLSNAVRYTPENGSIQLSVIRKESEVQFSVRDNGKGIEPNNLSKIFDKFVQIDPANIESSKSGVGLGLAISKEFVNALGGKIRVNSELGKGTVFYFTLPL